MSWDDILVVDTNDKKIFHMVHSNYGNNNRYRLIRELVGAEDKLYVNEELEEVNIYMAPEGADLNYSISLLLDKEIFGDVVVIPKSMVNRWLRED